MHTPKSETEITLLKKNVTYRTFLPYPVLLVDCADPIGE